MFCLYIFGGAICYFVYIFWFSSEQNLGRVRSVHEELAHAEAIYAESKTTGKPGVRPTNKIGFLGLIGKKVDSIEYYNEKIIELNQKLEMEQKDTLRDKQQDSALVFFTSRVIAASAAQRLHAQNVNKWTVTDAPEPRQLTAQRLMKVSL